MEANRAPSRPGQEPPAPVVGGMRWRKPYHDIFELCRRDKGLTPHDPDAPFRGNPVEPERGTDGAPRIVSDPPAEARVAGEYAYHARACDGYTDGFTWYFEKSPPGMHVDRHSGKVTWTPSEGGYVEVTLCARSVYGAASRQAWTVCVRKAAIIRKPAATPRLSAALRRKDARRRTPLAAPWRGTPVRGRVVPLATAPPGVRFRYGYDAPPPDSRRERSLTTE